MATRSRYDKCSPFTPELGAARTFPGIRPRVIPSVSGVVEHTLRAWDRPDLLAFHYYVDSSLWWRILDANPETSCAADLLDKSCAGTVIQVPRARE